MGGEKPDTHTPHPHGKTRSRDIGPGVAPGNMLGILHSDNIIGRDNGTMAPNSAWSYHEKVDRFPSLQLDDRTCYGVLTHEARGYRTRE